MQGSATLAGRLLEQFREVRAILAEAYGVDESVALETALWGGVRVDEGRVDETSMNRLTSAVAKIVAIKTQDSPTNIAWAHSGLENKTCNYQPERTYQNNPDRKDAENKRTTLRNFLKDRKTNQVYKNRSRMTNSGKYPCYGIIKKTASEIQNGDKDAVRITKDRKTVNNSPRYWDFRNHKNVQLRGHEMDSIVDRVQN